MATVYGLFTDQLCWYVGSTKQCLKQRLREHRSHKDYCGATLIPTDYDWEMRELERVEASKRWEAEWRWYEALKPILNQRVPPGKSSEVDSRYRQKNREAIRKRAREWARADYAKKKAQQNLEPA